MDKDQPKEEKICVSDGGRKTKRLKKTHEGVLDSSIGGSEGLYLSYDSLKDLKESGSHLNEVSSKLTKHVFYKESKDKNLAFSPLSLHVALGLTAACFDDEIRANILSFFTSDSIGALTKLLSTFNNVVLAEGSSSGGPQLVSANGVWFDKSSPIKQAFKEVVQDVYRAGFSKVDFRNKNEKARRRVNSWVEKKTSKLIKELLPQGSVDMNTKHILVNAIYFKGAWKKRFYAAKTKYHEFHLLNGKSIQIPLMTSSENQQINAYDGFKVLRLPYGEGDNKQDGRRFFMSIFLPGAKDGLRVLVDKLASEPKFVENHPADTEVRVGKFLIPKFKISFNFEASELLEGLGLVLPNTKVFVESCIEVNEEGTKAAAATAVVRKLIAGRFSPKKIETLDFISDHPFLFLIREDRTGVVLFSGIVLDPTAS